MKYYFPISHRLWVPFSNHSSNHTGTIPKNFQLRQRTTTIFKGKNAIFWQQNETLSFADICNLNQIYEFWQISRRTNIDFIHRHIISYYMPMILSLWLPQVTAQKEGRDPKINATFTYRTKHKTASYFQQPRLFQW